VRTGAGCVLALPLLRSGVFIGVASPAAALVFAALGPGPAVYMRMHKNTGEVSTRRHAHKSAGDDSCRMLCHTAACLARCYTACFSAVSSASTPQHPLQPSNSCWSSPCCWVRSSSCRGRNSKHYCCRKAAQASLTCRLCCWWLHALWQLC
jgi:hypothetical protein